jgi:hypothetical protein
MSGILETVSFRKLQIFNRKQVVDGSAAHVQKSLEVGTADRHGRSYSVHLHILRESKKIQDLQKELVLTSKPPSISSTG